MSEIPYIPKPEEKDRTNTVVLVIAGLGALAVICLCCIVVAAVVLIWSSADDVSDIFDITPTPGFILLGVMLQQVSYARWVRRAAGK